MVHFTTNERVFVHRTSTLMWFRILHVILRLYERDSRKIEKPEEENSIKNDVNQYTKAQLTLQSQTVKSVYQKSPEK